MRSCCYENMRWTMATARWELDSIWKSNSLWLLSLHSCWRRENQRIDNPGKALMERGEKLIPRWKIQKIDRSENSTNHKKQIVSFSRGWFSSSLISSSKDYDLLRVVHWEPHSSRPKLMMNGERISSELNSLITRSRVIRVILCHLLTQPKWGMRQ